MTARNAILIVSLALMFAVIAALPGFAQQATHEGEAIGTVDFQVTGDEAIQADFNRALAMMHHMMYAQARSDFEAIAEADPDCAMAYWGIATTLFQPLWGTRPSQDDLDRGWSNIQQAMELVQTDRERSLIMATEGFFREPDEADFRTRIDRWISGMKDAYDAHGDDADVAALYALALLAEAQRAEDRDPLHDEAEAVLREVHQQVPEHPGAIHYSIHATDVDGRAENALDMVRAYGEIAPDVPHALHMPSHIYVRLGDWPEVVDWNTRSAEAALDFPVNGATSHHYAHAVDYVIYARLQRGEDAEAVALFNEAMDKGPFQASFISAYHIAAMPARLAVERHQWDEAMDLEPRSPDYLPWDDSLWAVGMTWYARGLGGVHSGDMEVAREAENTLATLRDEAMGAGDEHFADYIEVDRLILDGLIAQSDDSDRALQMMLQACNLENRLEKHPVTPGGLLPPREALGDLLMDLERPDDALEAYRAAEEIWPGRYHTRLGAARAARAAGMDDAARSHYETLLEITTGTDRDGIKEARRYLDD